MSDFEEFVAKYSKKHEITPERTIIFLVRRRLGLKKREKFRFINQKSNAIYYFTSTDIMKADWSGTRPSSVSLHWLLNDECVIEKIK